MKPKTTAKKPTTKTRKDKHIIPLSELIDKSKYNQEFIAVKHFPNPGDQVAAMVACKKLYELTGVKVKFLQCLNVQGQYYAGATHPTVNEAGQNVTCNQQMFDMMKPLMESQEYIHSYERYEGQKVDFDFDIIRGTTFVNLPHLMIQGWLFFAFPDLATDLSKPWISLKGKAPKKILDQVQGKIILNFTERYRNNLMDYFFLKKYAPDLIFAGTEREHWLFTSQWQLPTVPRLQVENFLEYAHALKNCRFILGNQSIGWNLCQSMHVPRILEVCSYADNCQPFIGENSFGYFHQIPLEFYFRYLDDILP